MDVLIDLIQEIIEQARYGHRRPWSKGTIRFPGVLAHSSKHRNELFPSFSSLDAPEQIPDEGQCLPARGAPSARFSDKKFDQIQGSPDQTGLLVEDDDSTGPQPVPALL